MVSPRFPRRFSAAKTEAEWKAGRAGRIQLRASYACNIEL